jgi:hypothetical protein
MPDVFLSHSSLDKALAERVVSDLRSHGISVWYDTNEILVGHDIVERVYDGIKNSRYLAILLTRNSVRSKWVREELHIAKVSEIEDRKVCILPLLFKNCEIPAAIRTKKYADFRSDYQKGLSELLQVFHAPSFPDAISGNLTELENLFTTRREEINQFTYEILKLEQEDDKTFLLSNEYSDDNIQDLRHKVTDCLNLLDHLVSIEDSPRALLFYHGEGVELASMNLDHARVAYYLDYIIANDISTIDELLRSGIANANADQKHRAITSFRKALRTYLGSYQKLDGKSFIKLLYRITLHVRLYFFNPLFRDLIIYKSLDKETVLLTSLERTMDCFDDALRREMVFDFNGKMSNLNYGRILAYIGLTIRALVYLEKAVSFGCTKSELEPYCIEDLKEQISAYEASKNGEATIKMDIIQMPNFMLQFGKIEEALEDHIIEQFAPEFFKAIIQDDTVFTKRADKE